MLHLLYIYMHLVLPLLLSVPVNAMQPSDMDACWGALGSSVSDNASSISESSEEGSGTGLTLERRGLGLGTRARDWGSSAYARTRGKRMVPDTCCY